METRRSTERGGGQIRKKEERRANGTQGKQKLWVESGVGERASIVKCKLSKKVFTDIEAAIDAMGFKVPHPERLTFKDIEGTWEQFDPLDTDIIQSLMVRKIEMGSIGTG